MDLKFTCSSYLPPNNAGWKSLSEEHNLSFGEFGDWPLVFSKPKNEDVLIWLVIIEDIIPTDILFSRLTDKINKGKEIIDKSLELLKLRLKDDQLIFVAYVSESHDSVIRHSRSIPTTKILEAYFQSQLMSLVVTFTKLYSIPLTFSFSKEGINKCFDSRNFYLARIRFSQFGIKIISNEIRSIIDRINKPAAKVLVLDCDNTLWGGVVGESGISKILIGQDGIGKSFQAFQSGIKELSKNGLVLTVCSKNEEKDVIDVFTNHTQMVLSNDDISIFKANWTDKSANIIEIANELGLGLDSLVFWDDNPVEREKVKNQIPEVYVVEPPDEVVEWPNHLKSLDVFASFHKTKEDLNKVNQYKSKAKFEINRKKTSNANNFLEKINMKVGIQRLNESNISRAAQLCQKTNQMNLRLVRHDESSIKNLVKHERTLCFLVTLSDDFGDHGIISLVILTQSDVKDKAFLDTFLMSCRVLGRELEYFIFSYIKNKLHELNYKYLDAEYVKGERNTPAKTILQKMGLKIISKKQNEVYSTSIDKWKIKDEKRIKKLFTYYES